MTGIELVLYQVSNVVLYLALVAITTLVLYYWRVARWWASAEGRMIQAWNLWALIVMLYLTVRAIWGLMPVIDLVGLIFRTLVFVSGIGIFMWRGLLIAKAQKPRR